jgi:hypothetical protein
MSLVRREHTQFQAYAIGVKHNSATHAQSPRLGSAPAMTGTAAIAPTKGGPESLVAISSTLAFAYPTQVLLRGSDDLSVVQEALGHRDARTTRIYTTVKVNPRLITAVRKAFGS